MKPFKLPLTGTTAQILSPFPFMERKALVAEGFSIKQ
jgi:hypothetical protein